MSACAKKNITRRTPCYRPSDNSLTVHRPRDVVVEDQLFDHADTFPAADQEVAQDEALGYDNTMLLNVASLSEMARSTIQRRQGRDRPILEHDDSDVSSGDDESDPYADTNAREYTLDELSQRQLSDLFPDEDDSDDEDYLFEPSETDDFTPVESVPSPGRGDDDDLASVVNAPGEEWNNYVDPNAGRRPLEYPEELKASDLPIVDVCRIDLLSRLEMHGVSLAVFDNVMDWARSYATSHPEALLDLPRDRKKNSRRGFTKYLTRALGRDSVSPQVTTVKLPSGKAVSLPLFPFEAIVKDMLRDESLMRPENMVKDNFNEVNWAPIVDINERFEVRTTTSVLQRQRARLSEEVANLVQESPPCPTNPKDLEGKRIEVLHRYNEFEAYHWAAGTVKETIGRATTRQMTVRVKWDATPQLSYQSVTTSIPLVFSLWHMDVLNGWRILEDTIPARRRDHADSMSLDSDEEDEIPNEDIPLDDLYSGTMMTKAALRYLGGITPEGIDAVRLLPIVMFIDKSHTDLFGSLATTPVSFTLGCFNVECRRLVRFWRNMAFIPPLNVGSGTNAGKLDIDLFLHEEHQRRRYGDKRESESLKKLKDYHALLDVAFNSFRQSCKKGIVVEHRDGKKYLYKPFIVLSIGDTAGNNENCCHYNNSGNMKTSMLNYTCQCSPMDMIKTPVSCVPITREDVERTLRDEDEAKKFSQHQVRSAFHLLPLADMDGGIMVHMPKESLHVFRAGLYKGAIKVVHDLIGKKGKNAKYKDYLDQLHQRVSLDLRRNSERRMEPTSNRFGFLDLSRLKGDEVAGNLHVFVVCMHTVQGRKMMQPFLDRAGVPMPKFIYTLTLLLSYEQWTESRNVSRWEVAHSMPAVEELMRCIVRYLPRKVIARGDDDDDSNLDAELLSPVRKRTKGRAKKKEKNPIHEEGSNGWHTTKFHALAQFPVNMWRFGSSTTYNSRDGENHHKTFVKKTGKRTQRQVNCFTTQVGQRHAEANVIDHAAQLSSNRFPSNSRHNNVPKYNNNNNNNNNNNDPNNNNISSPECRGMYILDISAATGRGRVRSPPRNVKMIWNDWKKNQNSDQFRLNPMLTLAIVSCANEVKHFSQLVVKGYTEMRVPCENGTSSVVYRASPNYRGLPWYDWCIVQFPDTELRDKVDGEPCQCFAQIHGFIRYSTPGYPTYKLRKIDNKSPYEIKSNNLSDDDIYVVLACSDSWINMFEYENNFVTPFKLEKNALRILPISAIKKPLAVVKNYLAEDVTHYLACQPKTMWSSIFRNRIRQLSEGSSDVIDDGRATWWSDDGTLRNTEDSDLESTSEEEDDVDEEE